MSEDVKPYGARQDTPGARTDEFRALMAQLGWSQRRTADELEVDVRTVRYWAAANPEPSLSAIYALRYLYEHSPHVNLTAGAVGSMASDGFGMDPPNTVVLKTFADNGVNDDE